MSYHLNNGVPLQLDGNDTAPPPLPPWLKGFLVTSKKPVSYTHLTLPTILLV